jgi:hypothetical protein
MVKLNAKDRADTPPKRRGVELMEVSKEAFRLDVLQIPTKSPADSEMMSPGVPK